MSSSEIPTARAYLEVFDAFTSSHNNTYAWRQYNLSTNKFELVAKRAIERSLSPTLEALTEVHRQRYSLVIERIKTDPSVIWSPVLLNEEGNDDERRIAIHPITNVVGLEKNATISNNVTVVGYLRKDQYVDENGNSENRWMLEDFGSSVLLQLENEALNTNCFVCDNHIVLAEGYFEEGKTFLASSIRLPVLGWYRPISHKQELKQLHNYTVTFPSSHLVRSQEVLLNLKLEQLLMESSYKEAAQLFVFLGEVCLDQPECFEKLKALLKKFENGSSSAFSSSQGGSTPVCIVLAGNFSSQFKIPFENDDAHEWRLPASKWLPVDHYTNIHPYRQNFVKLYKLLLDCPNLLKSTRFVLIPGPDDPGLPLLPRPAIHPPLTSYLNDEIAQVGGNLTLFGNPLRLQHMGFTDMIFSRANLFGLLWESAIQTPNWSQCETPHTNFLSQWIREVIISQSHIFPIASCGYDGKPAIAIPPSLDGFLWLQPMPHLVLLSDVTMPGWCIELADCKLCNIGRFWSKEKQSGSYGLFETLTKKFVLSRTEELLLI